MKLWMSFVQRLLVSAAMTTLLTGTGMVLFGASSPAPWWLRIVALTPVAFVGSLVLGPAAAWLVRQLGAVGGRTRG